MQGQLGDGSTSNSTTPVAVTGLTDVLQVDAGAGSTTCALVVGGRVECWGWNYWGTVGDGTTTDALSPVDVVGLGSGVTDIGVGAYHVCAVASGSVLCWGKNADKELGNGLVDPSPTPVVVNGITDAIAADAGERHSCALAAGSGATSRSVKCWGNDTYGQVGVAGLRSQPVPVTVAGGLAGVVQLDVGPYTSCAVTSSSSGYCWGYNVLGEVGDGTTATAFGAKLVIGLTDVTAVANGGLTSCGVATGRAHCWGKNEYGELGNGTATGQFSGVPTPVAVIGLP
jgi:alpha-tubulin suppressor-like RCC1 family protein